MTSESGRRSIESRIREWALPSLSVALLILLIAVLAQPGVPITGAGGAIAFQILIESGVAPLVWLIGAVGLGNLVMRAMARRGNVSWSISLALGITISLWLAHAFGALGLWSVALGPVLAWALPASGIAWLALRGMRSQESLARRADPALLPWTALLGIPAIAVALVAACAPPGTLWQSEAMGFDALSYHLQLPRQWLALGRITPLEHNVYSFLPSYVEAAYLQLAAMHGGADAAANDGGATHSAQILHVLLAISAAAILGRLAVTVASRTGDDGNASLAHRAGGFTSSLMLLTPWTVVTSSLAYNEMAVLVCFAGALAVARAPDLSPWSRGALAGALVGAACGAKLTSVYLVAPSVALALACWTHPRQWPAIAALGVTTGAIALAPWLIRNGIASENPVFPFLTGVLGDAHWTSLESARWAAGHHIDLSAPQRLARLFSPERGLLHPQWSIMVFVAIAALVVTLASRRARPIALVLAGSLGLILLGWLSIGHLQSRFLLPTIVPIALLSGLALTQIEGLRQFDIRRASVWAALSIPLVLGVFTLFSFLNENDDAPNAGLAGGIASLNGTLAAESMAVSSPADQQAMLARLSPPAFANIVLPRMYPSSRINLYLLGESRPYYSMVPVIYHTTWDTSPLGALFREEDGDLAAAAARLREELGVTHLLVNLSELHRLGALGWYDPDVRIETAVALLTEHGAPIRSWPTPDGLGVHLVKLTPYQNQSDR